ncbi:hypothetical protein BGW80DRAFT_1314094 [Lactifluus volemus]|nr:hypothetical protein BGW80DRAFT_1314094 [Lactifluus volemus]
MDHSEWSELFEPFATVRTLRLSGKIQPFVVSSLRRYGVEGVTELLPGLQSLYLHQRYWLDELEERQAIEQFIAARQHSNHPVTVYYSPYHSDDA